MSTASYILRGETAILVSSGLALLSLIEGIILSRFQEYDWKSLGVSLMNLLFHWIGIILLPFSVSAPFVKFFAIHSLTHIPLNTWQAFLLLFFLLEFCYYWFHRASHRIRWFWVSHSIHHSPNNMNLSAGYRTGSFLRLTGAMLFFLPMYWIGFPPLAVTATITVNFWYQALVHMTWIPKLGWWSEYIFNTPSNHRVHHASNAEYLDKNYGSILIIFDRIFGTYVAEKEDLPCRYGLVQPQTSYNPFRVEFDPWIALFKDLLSSRSVGDFFGYLLKPPGWKPGGEEKATVRPVASMAEAKQG